MRRTFKLLPLALPIALFVGCEGTTQNDNVSTTDDALESCYATSDGATKCAIQSGGFSHDPQDVDHDGRPDAFVCAHIVKVPHGLGAGGASGTTSSSTGDPTGARPALPSVPSDCDCDRLGCQDMRPHSGGPGAGGGGVGGKPDPTSGPGAPAAADTAPTPATGDATGDDMKCPGPGPQQGPGDDGAGGAGAPTGRGPGGRPGDGHGAGGAGAR